jgi:hypothetical protein
MLQLLTSPYMHIVPLIAAAAIVFGATRDERPAYILANIVRSALWMTVFLGGIMCVLLGLGWFLRG